MRVFENRVLWRIFRSKRDKVVHQLCITSKFFNQFFFVTINRVILPQTTPEHNSAGYVFLLQAKIPNIVTSRSGSVGARW
jgi:hypothetical protein